MGMINGIDISKWNGDIDFKQVRGAGYDFAIIKAGGSDSGFYTDPKFNSNYSKALAAGLHVGAYYFTGPNFYGVKSGIADAMRFISMLDRKKFDYPVFVDIETTKPSRMEEATKAATSFCQTLEDAGYFVGIYASAISGFRERLNHEKLKRYCHWVAHYNVLYPADNDWQIWQKTSRGSVAGINGHVDIDVARYDFSSIIKSKGLNGYKKGEL